MLVPMHSEILSSLEEHKKGGHGTKNTTQSGHFIPIIVYVVILLQTHTQQM